MSNASREDFAEYVEARWPRLVRSARYLGCSQSEAEDLVQSTLERAYRHWHKVVRAEDTDAYVFRVMLNVLSKSRARRWSLEQPSDGALDDGEPMADPSDRLATRVSLFAALRRLSKDQRQVLVLRYYADLSAVQVAAVLDVPVGTIKSRSARAIKQLGALLNETPSGL